MSMSSEPVFGTPPRAYLSVRPTMRAAKQIIQMVCKEFHFTEDELTSVDRHRTIVEVRQITIWLLRTARKLSYPEIGILLRRDHTTIMANFRSVERKMKTDRHLAGTVDRLLLECGRRVPEEGLIDGFESGRHE